MLVITDTKRWMESDIMNGTISKIQKCIHPNCIVCGFDNTRGLNLKFSVSENESVEAIVWCDKNHEGYTDMMHGGMISTLLDGAMTNCLFAKGITAVTVELNIKFRQPVLLNKHAKVVGRIVENSHPLYFMAAEITQEGKVKATAKAKFFNQRKINKDPLMTVLSNLGENLF